MKLSVAQEIYLHTDNGASVYESAELLGRKPNSVIHNLRRHKVLRRALGRDIEEEVAQWFEKQGLTVARQRGDAPFDILAGSERIDVKSANLSQNGNYPRYYFQLQDLSNRSTLKKFTLHLDSFLLVFLSEDNAPMYTLNPDDVLSKASISIPKNISNSKYPLQFIGYLR